MPGSLVLWFNCYRFLLRNELILYDCICAFSLIHSTCWWLFAFSLFECYLQVVQRVGGELNVWLLFAICNTQCGDWLSMANCDWQELCKKIKDRLTKSHCLGIIFWTKIMLGWTFKSIFWVTFMKENTVVAQKRWKDEFA